MTFVFPILLGGLGLLLVPVLIHLIFRQKPRRLKFPAFRFLMQRSKTNLRKLQLRHLLLLVMRMLLLALVCLALARPKVSGDLLSLQTDRPVAIVLLFDTSYSMQYKTTSDKNRLDEAREQALRLLETLHHDSRVIVLDTAEPAGAQAEWLKRDKAQVKIKSLALRYDNGPVTRRLEDAYHIFAKLAQATDDDYGRRLPRVLCVLSDRTTACWDKTQVGYLQNLADSIAPPLERLRAIQGGIPAKVALLKELRQQLPLAKDSTQDYSEQSLIAEWEELRQKIPTAGWDNYPDTGWNKLLGTVRGHSRDLLKQIRAHDPDKLSPTEKSYRQKLIDALEQGLRYLQGVSPFFVDVGVEDAVDLAVTALDFMPTGNGSSELRDTFAPGEPFQVQVYVQATGSKFENLLQCEVIGRGKPMTQNVELQPGEGKSFYFEMKDLALQPNFYQVRVSFTLPDQLPFSDQRFGTFLIRPPRKVLFITDNPAGTEKFEHMLQLNEKVRFDCTTVTPDKVLEEIGKNKGPQQLAGYHAIYLFNVAEPKDELWKHLKTYVAEGGSLGVIPGGAKLNADRYNSDAAQAVLPGKLESIIKATSDKEETGAVWNWDDDTIYQHPLLKPFGDWKRIARADFIAHARWAYYFWKVQPRDKDKDAAVLVRYKAAEKSANNQPALLERKFGKSGGRVVLLTTRLDFPIEEAEWNNYWKTDTSWPLVLPGELTIYLAGDLERLKLNFLTGQGVPALAIPAGVADKQFQLKMGPSVLEMLPRPEKHNDLQIRKAVVPGNYSVDAGEKESPVGQFSVNLPPEEASLKRVAIADIEAVFGQDAVRSFKPGDTFDAVLEPVLARPEELFPILMLALLILLALENLLGNLFYRREPRVAESGGSP